jgi:hypothetical protein
LKGEKNTTINDDIAWNFIMNQSCQVSDWNVIINPVITDPIYRITLSWKLYHSWNWIDKIQVFLFGELNIMSVVKEAIY